MFKFSQALINGSRNNKVLHSFTRFNNYASATVQNATANSDVEDGAISKLKSTPQVNKSNVTSQNSIVAAAFASLQTATATNSDEITTPFTDNRISKARSINELLSISEGAGISRRHALKVVSILADWSASGKIKLVDFEMDPRFIKLCKVLTHGLNSSKQTRIANNKTEDLNTILNVTADDEAAKLVASITLPQMVKVMSSLALKKRRSIMLLRSLSFNITRDAEKLDLKQSADLLYSMAVLNFPDNNLLERVTADICSTLHNNTDRSAVVGSILTSLGLLKYKNRGVLDALSRWILQHQDVCRPQDTFSLILTLAMLNYEPCNADKLYEVVIPQLIMSDTSKANIWLELVWSLVILNRATPEHVASVLKEDFVRKIEEDFSNISPKLKLLNIDAASKYLMKDYKGPRLDSKSSLRNLNLLRSKEKQEFSNAVTDSLKNLVQSESCLKTNVDTGMGFYIDAECIMDKKSRPIPFDKYTGTNTGKKIAVVVCDYHDFCLGSAEPTGINALASKLLQAQGYRLLTVPYYEFRSRDKLIIRVQYIESKLKTIINS